MTDPVAIRIAEIREDLRTPGEEAADRIREQHLPALLAAVEAVLKRHQRRNGGPPGYVDLCTGCTGPSELDGRAVPNLWPCPTYRRVEAALLGGED